MDTVHKVVLAELVTLVLLSVLAACGVNKPTAATPVNVTVIGAAAAPHVQATIYSLDSCIPCRTYIKEVLKELPLSGWIVRYVSDKDHATAHVVIDKRGESITKFAIEKLPCTVFRVRGKENDRVYGAMSAEDLVKRINRLAKENP